MNDFGYGREDAKPMAFSRTQYYDKQDLDERTLDPQFKQGYSQSPGLPPALPGRRATVAEPFPGPRCEPLRRKASKEKDHGGAAMKYLEEKYIMDQRPQLDASADTRLASEDSTQ